MLSMVALWLYKFFDLAKDLCSDAPVDTQDVWRLVQCGLDKIVRELGSWCIKDKTGTQGSNINK